MFWTNVNKASCTCWVSQARHVSIILCINERANYWYEKLIPFSLISLFSAWPSDVKLFEWFTEKALCPPSFKPSTLFPDTAKMPLLLLWVSMITYLRTKWTNLAYVTSTRRWIYWWQQWQKNRDWRKGWVKILSPSTLPMYVLRAQQWRQRVCSFRSNQPCLPLFTRFLTAWVNWYTILYLYHFQGTPYRHQIQRSNFHRYQKKMCNIHIRYHIISFYPIWERNWSLTGKHAVHFFVSHFPL